MKRAISIFTRLEHLGNTLRYPFSFFLCVLEFDSMKVSSNWYLHISFKSWLHEVLFEHVVLERMLILKIKRFLMHRKCYHLRRCNQYHFQNCNWDVDSRGDNIDWLPRCQKSRKEWCILSSRISKNEFLEFIGLKINADQGNVMHELQKVFEVMHVVDVECVKFVAYHL